MKTGLMHGDHIHIALAEDLIRRLGPLRNMKAVQISALVKNLCLGRIEIFWLGVSHDSSAKPDDLAPHIHDRKDHAVPEFVVHPSLFVIGRDARFQDHVVGIAAMF